MATYPGRSPSEIHKAIVGLTCAMEMATPGGITYRTLNGWVEALAWSVGRPDPCDIAMETAWRAFDEAVLAGGDRLREIAEEN